MIIDETYFQKQYYVPNVDELNSRNKEDIRQYIETYVRLCLQDALGYVLFKDLEDNISNGNLNSDAPQKWLNLVNGVEYTKNGKTYYWKGLKYKEGAFKMSLLTPYVYYHWLKDNQSKVMGVGEVVLDAKNGINVNSTQRLVNTWNDFVRLYQEATYEYEKTVYHYRGVKVTDYIGNSTNNNYVSLIKFLYDNDTDYPDAPLKCYKFENQLGL